jgi:hypothetical protein
MEKLKVKFNESIAGLADPKPTAELDKKYQDKIASMGKGRPRPFSEAFTKQLIDQMKAHDRYGEKPLGFHGDFTFKIGDEAMIDAELARKWEANGTCSILETGRKAA